MNIEDALQIVLCQRLARKLARVIEGERFARDERGTLHHGDLVDAVREALGDQRDVVLRRFGKAQVIQPYAREDMSLFQDQQRPQADRLQHGGVKQRQIEAGAELLSEHGVDQTHALAVAFKARGRHSVNDVLLLQGAVERRRLPQHAVRVMALIGVERRVARPAAQQLRRPGKKRRERGMVGRDEGAQQLRRKRRAVPLVECKSGQLRLGGAKLRFPLKEPRGHNTAFPLAQARKVGCVRQQHGAFYRKRAVRGQALDVPRRRQAKHRTAGDAHIDALDALVRIIIENKRAQDRHAVLLQSIIDHRNDMQLHAERRKAVLHARDLLYQSESQSVPPLSQES